MKAPSVFAAHKHLHALVWLVEDLGGVERFYGLWTKGFVRGSVGVHTSSLAADNPTASGSVEPAAQRMPKLHQAERLVLKLPKAQVPEP